MIDQARGGENVEALFRRYGPELRRHAGRLLQGTSHDPDDVLQEVTLRALARHGDAPLHLAYPRAWLHTCVQNACLSHLRSARSAPPPLSLQDEVALGDHHDPHALVARRTEAREVLEDLARLDVRQRRALLVSALSEGSHADVAQELGGTERAVTSLVSRARGNLKAMRDARATPCTDIRAEIDDAALRGVRAPELVRRHAQACRACRLYGEGRRRRSRIAGILAPLHGLAAALSQRLGEAVAPAAVDTGLAHGMAIVAVLAGGAAHGVATTPTAEARASSHAHVRTIAHATRPAAFVAAAAPPVTKAPRKTSAVKRHKAAPAPTVRSPKPAAPVKRNLFGCPQVQGRLSAADLKCRNAHQAEVRRAIEARLARQQAAAAVKAQAAAEAAVTPAPASSSAPEQSPAPAPAPTQPSVTTPATTSAPTPASTTIAPPPPSEDVETEEPTPAPPPPAEAEASEPPPAPEPTA